MKKREYSRVKHTYFWGLVSVVSGVILLLAPRQRYEQLVFALNSTPTRDPFDSRVFPGDLICDGLEGTSQGPAWEGIEIGSTTRSEFRSLLATLNPHYEQVDAFFQDGMLLFILSDRWNESGNLPYSIALCILDDTVATLQLDYLSFNLPLPPFNFTDFVAEHGKPDTITWTSDPSVTRSAFWFEQGIAIEFSVLKGVSFGGVPRIVYFPYQSTEGYEIRWPYNRTLMSSEFRNLEELYGAPNPFNLEAMLATITAQPSRTPTPTFTPWPTQTATPTLRPTSTPD